MAGTQQPAGSRATDPSGLRSSGGTAMYTQRAVAPEKVASAAPAPKPAETAVFEAAECLIYFDYDRAQVRRDQIGTIDQCAGYFRDHPNARLRLEGHADERGSVAYNQKLAEQRARAVQQQLVQRGVRDQQLSVASFGEQRPAEKGAGEDTWSRNRRVEFSAH